MKDFLTRRFTIPGLGYAERTVRSLSLTGKFIFGIFSIVFIVSAIVLLSKVNNSFLVEVPKHGGTLVEGVVGFPRFINPILAVTDGDKDVAALVYSGLMRQLPNGNLIPDLADKYTVSSDGKTYDFIIKSSAVFHDGVPLTADDIIFTVAAIQNPANKSPREALWNGVVATKINDHEVSFTLQQPYAPFLETTTLGILPKHLFTKTSEDMSSNGININPVGSGPYKLESISHQANGVASSYTLIANNKFVLGAPYISTVSIHFYDSEQNLISAYQNGDVDDVNGISPTIAEDLQQSSSTVVEAALPRIFGVFFNQNMNPAFADTSVRQALAMSVDRRYIVSTVLRGFGTPLEGPVPARFVGTSTSDAAWMHAQVDIATNLLEKNGWTLGSDGIRVKKTKTGTTTLAFSISTSDAPELKAAADILKDEWRRIGADVTIKVVEGGYLNQNIIRPRKYEALLFGQVVNRDLDLYSFWHSSQINDPGLNVALYSNPKADKLLEGMRIISDHTIREKAYNDFDALIQKDMPAVFLYSPNFIYVMSPSVRNVSIAEVSVPSERFGSIYSWYMETDKIWKIFAH